MSSKLLVTPKYDLGTFSNQGIFSLKDGHHDITTLEPSSNEAQSKVFPNRGQITPSTDEFSKETSTTGTSSSSFSSRRKSNAFENEQVICNERRKLSSTSSSSRLRTPAVQRTSASHSRTLSRGWASSHSKSSTPHPRNSFNIVALVEGRGVARGEIGLAYVDLRNPVIVLSQFADTQTYVRLATQLNILKPIEIIIPNTVNELCSKSKLFQRITELFPDVTTVTVQRKYFNETIGMQCVQDLCIPEYKTVELEVTCKYYCLSAFAALIKYIECIQNAIYHANSLKIIYCVSSNTTMIDTSTAFRLELVTNELGKIEHSLYGILNRTQTPGGNRLLRANLLQPPCDVNTINTRLDCIAELIDNEELFHSLKSVIGHFVDTELLLSFCVQSPKNDKLRAAEQNIQNVIYLKHTLDLVEPLRNILAGSKNPLFRTYYEASSDERFNDLKEKLSLVIHSDARYQKGALNARFQKCFVIKPNINGLLDIARRTYTETIDDIMELVKQLGEQHNLPLKVNYNALRGFFIQVPVSHRVQNQLDMPPIFIKVKKMKNTITCTTDDLIKMNDRIRDSMNEISIMSNAIITEILNTVRENIGCMYKLTEAVSTLDFLVSLAHVCTLSDYVRPEFCETLCIVNGKNPILEKIGDMTFIPNNTFICEEINFLVITGSNMSGKSTYLKQVALLQIMAQIGSYVPAQTAYFRITDQIFSRMKNTSNLEKNYSSFMNMMKETNYILQHATDKSLVLLDELGQGTSREEGCGIAYAVCEQLLITKAFILCSTHFIPLTKLENVYPNVVNYHFQVDYGINSSDQSMICNFTHLLKQGPCKEYHYVKRKNHQKLIIHTPVDGSTGLSLAYPFECAKVWHRFTGIKVAELSSMPREVVDEAKRLIQEWSSNENVEIAVSPDTSYKKSKLTELGIRLCMIAKSSTLDEESLKKYLKNLQNQYKSLLALTQKKDASSTSNDSSRNDILPE